MDVLVVKPTIMGEPADHFQEFFPEEKLEISMFEELSRRLNNLECNNYLVRRCWT